MRYSSAPVPSMHALPPFWRRQRWVATLLEVALVLGLIAAGVFYFYVKFSRGSSSEQVLTSRSGEVRQGKIEGRSADLVKMRLSDGQEHFYPIADLTAADRAIVEQLPVSLMAQYPFESTLTNQQARKLAVMILGRTADAVNFIRLSDRKMYTYAIAKLAAADQEFVRSLPLSAPATAAAALTAANVPVVAEAKNGQLVKQMQNLVAKMILATTSPDEAGGPAGVAQSGGMPAAFDAGSGAEISPQTTGMYGQANVAAVEQVAQQYQQLTGVAMKLEQGLAKTNPTDDAAVEQQLMTAQSQLQQLYQQREGTVGQPTTGADGAGVTITAAGGK
jgi:hypothetical protein